MSIVIEHDRRRYEILESALDIFMEEGFENVTFQKIADRYGITRTTLYIYFKNKKEVFNFSIKQFLQEVEVEILKVKEVTKGTHTEKLLHVMTAIIDKLEENRRLLTVILNYLMSLSKTEHDPDTRVRRRTVRLRRLLSAMLREGVKKGDFHKPLKIKETTEIIYSFLESAVFRLAVLRHKKLDTLKDAIKAKISSLAI